MKKHVTLKDEQTTTRPIYLLIERPVLPARRIAYFRAPSSLPSTPPQSFPHFAPLPPASSPPIPVHFNSHRIPPLLSSRELTHEVNHDVVVTLDEVLEGGRGKRHRVLSILVGQLIPRCPRAVRVSANRSVVPGKEGNNTQPEGGKPQEGWTLSARETRDDATHEADDETKSTNEKDKAIDYIDIIHDCRKKKEKTPAPLLRTTYCSRDVAVLHNAAVLSFVHRFAKRIAHVSNPTSVTIRAQTAGRQEFSSEECLR